MKHAATLPFLVAASLLRADWVPHSPLLRIGSELDVHFTAKAKSEFTDNLFYRSTSGLLPDSALSLEFTPGLDFQYGKDLPLSASLTFGRTFVDYLDSELRQLDDEQDAFAFSTNYDGGGPLLVSVGASYAETARNNAELQLTPNEFATLVRQSAASRILSVTYGFTEKFSATVGVRDSAIRYYDQDLSSSLTNAKSFALPIDLRFKYSEKVVAGFSFDFGTTDIHDSNTGAYRWSYDRSFYGLNLSYQPTEKLQGEFKAGLQSTEYDFSSTSSDSPSYTLSLTHSITEKLDQSLSIGMEAGTAANGGISESFRLSYGLNLANSQAWRSSFGLNYRDSSIDSLNDPLNPTAVNSSTDVRSFGVSLGTNYSPDDHWTFGANYSFSRTIDPVSYNINRVSLEASLRW
jgi:hypothetical protein